MVLLLTFLISVTVLIFIHEFGHYIVAKLSGVKVLVFSIGFGRPLLKYKDFSGTEWVFSIIPLGGYVKLWDHSNTNNLDKISKPEESFSNRSFLVKGAIVLAGPFANFLFAIVLFSIVNYQNNIRISNIIEQPTENSVARSEGVKRGDMVISIDETKIMHFDQLLDYLRFKLIEDKQLNSKLYIQSEDELKVVSIKFPQTKNLDLKQITEEVGIKPISLGVEVVGIVEDSPAFISGFEKGDRIVSVNGEPVRTPAGFTKIIDDSKGKKLVINLYRNYKFLEMNEKLLGDKVNGEDILSITLPELSEPSLGLLVVPSYDFIHLKNSLLDSIGKSLVRTEDTVKLSITVLIQALVGKMSIENLVGPLQVASIAESSLNSGFFNFFKFLALLSISIGVINLLPIPLLDGGNFLIYFIEFLKGSPFSLSFNIFLQQVGLLVIIGLTLLAILNDLKLLFNF